VELDAGAEKIGAKIRNATINKVPNMLVIGEQEATSRSVSVRPYHDVEGAIKGTLTLDAFVAALKEKVQTKWYAK
jgi:threonyl-tRNA synthetase